jgi:hypothetical protein
MPHSGSSLRGEVVVSFTVADMEREEGRPCEVWADARLPVGSGCTCMCGIVVRQCVCHCGAECVPVVEQSVCQLWSR